MELYNIQYEKTEFKKAEDDLKKRFEFEKDDIKKEHEQRQAELARDYAEKLDREAEQKVAYEKKKHEFVTGFVPPEWSVQLKEACFRTGLRPDVRMERWKKERWKKERRNIWRFNKRGFSSTKVERLLKNPELPKQKRIDYTLLLQKHYQLYPKKKYNYPRKPKPAKAPCPPPAWRKKGPGEKPLPCSKKNACDWRKALTKPNLDAQLKATYTVMLADYDDVIKFNNDLRKSKLQEEVARKQADKKEQANMKRKRTWANKAAEKQRILEARAAEKQRIPVDAKRQAELAERAKMIEDMTSKLETRFALDRKSSDGSRMHAIAYSERDFEKCCEMFEIVLMEKQEHEHPDWPARWLREREIEEIKWRDMMRPKKDNQIEKQKKKKKVKKKEKKKKEKDKEGLKSEAFRAKTC